MKKLTSIVALALPIFIGAGVGVAAQPDSGAPDGDAQIKALLQEHEESTLGYVESYAAFRPRFTELAEKQRGTEAEVRANLWLLQQSWWLRDEGKMETTSYPIAKDLLKRHPDSPQLGLLIEYQYVFTTDQRKELFSKLIEVSPHRSVQAAAHFGLARFGRVRNANGEPNEHYQALVEDYAAEPWRLTTFGAIADAYLNPHPKEALSIGQPAPEIVGIDHKGNPMRLSDFRGKVVMLDFWGHWRGPCRAMYPHERSLVEKYADAPFAIVGVNSDDTFETLHAAMKDEKLTWPSFFDGGGTGGPIATQWGVRGWPTVYILDHEGVIRYVGRNDLDSTIADLVQKAEIAAGGSDG